MLIGSKCGVTLSRRKYDVGLDHGSHQHGDIQVLIHMSSDTGGAYRIVERRQGEGDKLTADDLLHLIFPVSFPEKNNVVKVCGTAVSVG